jgi:hypothetical protein
MVLMVRNTKVFSFRVGAKPKEAKSLHQIQTTMLFSGGLVFSRDLVEP